jgi:acylphosphatase
MSGSERLDAVVRGRVQGVGFRYHVLHRAAALDLDGWVANEADGSVRCRAEGSRGDLEALVAALRTGPAGARVDDVHVAWSRASGGLGPFDVRGGAHTGD